MNFKKNNILLLIIMSAFYTISSKDSIDMLKIDSKKSETSSKNKKDKDSLNYKSEQRVFSIKVDFLVTETDYAKKNERDIEDLKQNALKEMTDTARKFEEKKKLYDEKRDSLSQEARQKMENELNEMIQSFQYQNALVNETITQEDAKLKKKLFESLEVASKEFLNRDKNKNVILIPSSGVHIHSQFDATEEIKNIMNKNFSKEEEKKKNKEKED